MRPRRQSLDYETGKPAVTRTQFRLLLLLVLVQVVMTAQSNYAPGLLNWARAQWAARRAEAAEKARQQQVAAAEKARRQQAAALEQQCQAFTELPDRVVWEEDPRLAAPLLTGGGYEAMKVRDMFMSPASDFIAPGACRGLPSFMHPAEAGSVVPAGGAGVAFVHGRRSPGGTERLVVVWVTGQTHLPDSVRGSPPPTREAIDFQLTKDHGLEARSLTPGPDPGPIDQSALWLRAPDQPVEMPAHWAPPAAPGGPPVLAVDYREQFRVYAGQPDPADPARFTIDYALDGSRGTIDGYLEDSGSVNLKPRQGRVVARRWYPYAK